ncbi:MAG: CusA/CzcA family heavy metal efflux RND transporter [Thiomicrorhabdus chilensis]|uniref:efflux RND transporter permease subunit n=1 Tax=Thiomicrorhabdus chilensis TaxID=63656 RepID=UPI00299CFAB1|nr:CusA/CzcA family heavy metal efflux RND transporter [Thiomicrorhabdus chilensis]MDX1348403.1 CusA/CzcA family heavy metal efflux RND transporter [Thiomicrorhabdus chilensis]
MLSRLMTFFLAQRVMALLLAVGLISAGWMAFQKTPVDAFPDVSPTQVKIIMKAPGMTPSEVESRIIVPIEVEMLGVPGQQMLRSMGKYGIADITIDFVEGTDIYWARQQISERLSGVSLPEGISGGIAPMTTPLGDIFMFTVEGDTLDNMEKRDLLDWVIRPALRAVPGVADVNALGGKARVFAVVPDSRKMSALKIPFNALAEALNANNRNDGAGRLTQGEEALLVRSIGNLEGVEDIGNIVVATYEGRAIHVKDIADVRVEALTRYGAVTQNGQGEAVQGLVIGLRGANTSEVIKAVRDQLELLKPALPDGISVDVFYDRGDLIEKAIYTVSKALVEAVVLVVLLLLLFLGNVRAAVTVALVLPLAALMTFIFMNWFGLSANLMSLGGLAIAIGMLVDAAVVVVENIVTHQAKEAQGSHRRLPKLHIIYRAMQEVAMPVISGIGIIMIVFLPLLTLQGLEGKLFVPVALTIVFALGSALILSLTIIPVISSYLLGEASHELPWLMRHLSRGYRPLLEWALKHDRLVMVLALVALLFAGVIYTQVGKTFMPQMDEGDLIVQLEKVPSISLEESKRLDQQVQKALLAQVPEIERIVARLGADEIGLDPMSLNDTDSFLVLKPRDQWRMASKEALIEEIRHILETQFPGINYAFTQPIQMRVDEMLTGARGDIAIKIFGDNPQELTVTAEKVAALVETIDGAEDVFTSQNDGMKYVQLQVDSYQAGRLGVSVNDLQDRLRAYLEGMPAGVIYQGNRQIPLIIRADGSSRASKMEFLNQAIVLDNGQSVQLNQLVKVVEVDGPVSIQREKGKRFSVVVANVSGRDLVSFVEEAKLKAAELDVPPGYYYVWGGEFENQQRAAQRLMIVVPIALILIFIILFSTFRSATQATMVLSNIPFALIGGIVALWLTGEYLSVPASVGFIALLGIAVLNGVVMMTYFNQLIAQGMPVEQVVVEGAMRRLRPVLMTASIAALGLIPLVFASGPGSEIQRPLAIVVIGGLITSTILTLLILPIIYRMFGVKSLGLEEQPMQSSQSK